MSTKAITNLAVNSEANQWPKTGWDNIAKTFYVTLTDENQQPIEGETATLEFLDKDGVEVVGLESTLISTSPVSDKNGVVQLSYLLSGETIKEETVVYVYATSGGIKSKDAFLLQLITARLAKPNIPAMIDGVIDDDDVERGVYAYATVATTEAAELYFCWENSVLAYHIPSGMESYAIKLEEAIIENGQHPISYYVVDGTNNGRFSLISTANVERVNGGGNPLLEDLELMQIIEGEETGYINKAMSDKGVTLFIPEWPMIMIGENEKVPATIDEKKTGTIILQGYTKKNERVGNPIFRKLKVGEFDNTAQTFEVLGEVAQSSFFNAIGEGSVEIKYSLSLVEDNKTHSSKFKRYAVDVIPPARKNK